MNCKYSLGLSCISNWNNMKTNHARLLAVAQRKGA